MVRLIAVHGGFALLNSGDLMIKWLVILGLLITGCESEQEAQIRYCKEHEIPYTTYTSPTTQWHQKTLDTSNRTGVPLDEVRSIQAAEGRAAAEQTIIDRSH